MIGALRLALRHSHVTVYTCTEEGVSPESAEELRQEMSENGEDLKAVIGAWQEEITGVHKSIAGIAIEESKIFSKP